jgi:adenylate kinase
MNLVLLGPPGAGKGTQAALLTEQYRIPKISTGEMLRDVAQQGGDLGRQIAQQIDRGGLVADDVVLDLVRRRLREPDTEAGFVLDGFPRTVAQAEALEALLGEDHGELSAVLNFEVGEAELIRRLSARWICPVCGASYHLISHPPRQPGRCDVEGAPLEQRPDDRPEAVRERLRLYEQRTRPVIDYYRARGLLCSIPGEQAMEDVARQVRQVLADLPGRRDAAQPAADLS